MIKTELSLKEIIDAAATYGYTLVPAQDPIIAKAIEQQGYYVDPDLAMNFGHDADC